MGDGRSILTILVTAPATFAAVSEFFFNAKLPSAIAIATRAQKTMTSRRVHAGSASRSRTLVIRAPTM